VHQVHGVRQSSSGARAPDRRDERVTGGELGFIPLRVNLSTYEYLCSGIPEH